MFARRVAWDLTPNALAAALAARRAAGLPVLDLTDSNPTRAGLEAPRRAWQRALRTVAEDPRGLDYAPDPCGDPAARAAVARHHALAGCPVDPAQVVLTSGTSEAYAHLFRLLADPGDRVLVPRPGYPLFDYLAGLESVETDVYPLRAGAAGAWRIDLDALEAAVEARTRAVLVVQPHNPTGARVAAAEAARLGDLCRRRGLALISDEVFLASSPAAGGSLLAGAGTAEAGPLRFALSGASKLLALPQLKLSWIVVAGPETLRREALARLELVADTFLSVSGPAQLALPSLLDAEPGIRAELVARLAGARERVRAALVDEPGIELLPSAGGWAALLELRAGEGGPAPDEDALVEALLEAHGVVVHPGWLFDLAPRSADGEPAAHLVLSLLTRPDALDRGLRAIVRAARAGQPSAASPSSDS